MMKPSLIHYVIFILVSLLLILLYRDVERGQSIFMVHVPRTAGGNGGSAETGLQLDVNEISKKYGGIKLLDLAPVTFNEIGIAEAEDRFFKFFTKKQVECGDVKRMGSQGDGGWDMCVSPPYSLQKTCIVYSFGTGSDWSFDDHMSGVYGCEVHAFDPTVQKPPFKHPDLVHFNKIGLFGHDGQSARGPVQTLATIFKERGHTDKVIDYLKVDIEGSEWPAFKTMLKEGSLKNVKQFAFEFHTPDTLYFNKKLGVTSKEDYVNMMNIMLEIENQGFKRYLMHENVLGNFVSSFTGKKHSCCWELYYINLNFLKT